MSNERDYYRAEGTSRALIAAYMDARNKASAAAQKLARKYGATNCVSTNKCEGLAFKGEIPTGIGVYRRQRDPAGWAFPDRTVKGKVLKALLNAITFPDQEDLAIKLMGKREWVPVPGKGTFRQVGPMEYRHIDGDYYVAMEAGTRAPKHCTPLKRSEFWALIEAAETTKGVPA